MPRQGFSLLELLIVAAIMAILTALAVPAWRGHVEKARRLDAQTMLLHLASRQEIFYLQQRRYARTAELSLAPPLGLGLNLAYLGDYQLTAMASAANFIAIATVDPTGRQRHDLQCARFSIDARGTQHAFAHDGRDTTDLCWR